MDEVGEELNGFHSSEGQDYIRDRYIARLAYKFKKQTVGELRKQQAQAIEYLEKKTQREPKFSRRKSKKQFPIFTIFLGRKLQDKE